MSMAPANHCQTSLLIRYANHTSLESLQLHVVNFITMNKDMQERKKLAVTFLVYCVWYSVIPIMCKHLVDSSAKCGVYYTRNQIFGKTYRFITIWCKTHEAYKFKICKGMIVSFSSLLKSQSLRQLKQSQNFPIRFLAQTRTLDLLLMSTQHTIVQNAGLLTLYK